MNIKMRKARPDKMKQWLKYQLNYLLNRRNNKVEQTTLSQPTLLTGELTKDIITLRTMFSNSLDFLVREVEIGDKKIALLMCEGMISLQSFSELVVEPLQKLQSNEKESPRELLKRLSTHYVFSADQNEIFTCEEIFRFIMSGFVIILIDGTTAGLACGMQGFSFRSISEPETQVNVRGSKEGFVEPLRINLTMIRRRIKSPQLKFELMSVGKVSNTDICMVYMCDTVSKKMLREIRSRLKKIPMDIVLESGYLQPFLDKKPLSIFSGIGTTERPDCLCAKIAEGRVGILVDGTPFALIAPFFFTEHFQSMDDYTQRPFYATFIRWLKYFSFFLTILLPGLYVAVVTYHPELLPQSLLFNIAVAEESTPFPLMLEALIIHIIFEIMREAGLRLPRAVGHAVSIVGALVIGDAAVTAGLIGSPMIMIVALTAVSSFVVPSVYEAVSVLRISFILIGGCWGLLGITLGLAIVGVNMCAVNPLGIPFTSPLTPFKAGAMRDVLFRAGWKSLSKHRARVQDFPGSEIDEG